jgi:hypothetical protein
MIGRCVLVLEDSVGFKKKKPEDRKANLCSNSSIKYVYIYFKSQSAVNFINQKTDHPESVIRVSRNSFLTNKKVFSVSTEC